MHSLSRLTPVCRGLQLAAVQRDQGRLVPMCRWLSHSPARRVAPESSEIQSSTPTEMSRRFLTYGGHTSNEVWVLTLQRPCGLHVRLYSPVCHRRVRSVYYWSALDECVKHSIFVVVAHGCVFCWGDEAKCQCWCGEQVERFFVFVIGVFGEEVE